jgi:hypothetical protein
MRTHQRRLHFARITASLLCAVTVEGCRAPARTAAPATLASAVDEIVPPPDPRLAKVLDRADFEGVPLAELLDELGRRGGIGIVRADPTIGNASVTLHLKNASLSTALTAAILLGTNDQVDWTIRGGSAVVGDPCRVEEISTHTFNVRPLLDPDDTHRPFGGHYSGPGPMPTYVSDREESLARLMWVITDCIEPENWLANGGTWEIIPGGDRLVVRAPDRVQRQLARLLAAMKPEKLAAFGHGVETRMGTFDSDPKLSKMLGVVDFDHTPISAALGSLAEKGGINVVPLWLRLRGGVDADTPITVHLKNVDWSSALDAVLVSAGGDIKCGWDEIDGVVFVGELGERIGHGGRTVVYDVGPVLAPEGPLTTVSNDGRFFRYGQSQFEMSSRPDSACELAERITQTVSPETWQGVGSSIDIWGDQLVITTTEQVHLQIAAFLRQQKPAR